MQRILSPETRERVERGRQAWNDYETGKICYDEMLRRSHNPDPHPYTAEVFSECWRCKNLEDCKERYGWIWIKTADNGSNKS